MFRWLYGDEIRGDCFCVFQLYGTFLKNNVLSEKHVEIVESIERYFPRLSNPKESKEKRLTEEKVIGDFGKCEQSWM